MKTLIKVDHLHLGYDNQEVINDLSFDINQGDFITVLGLSLIHISEPTRP